MPAFTPAYTNEQIEVVYDVEACNAIGYWVLNASKAKIVEDPHIILFHELAHAFHWANRSSQICQGHAQFIDDENQARIQFNLEKRHVVDDAGGCGPPSTYGNPWQDCFILNAVSGSPHSPLVREFERIRDSLMRPSRPGRQLFARLIAEYYQFAPHVVADMETDPQLKEAMKRWVVEPLLDALTLIELHIRRDLRSGDWNEEIARVLGRGAGRAPPMRRDSPMRSSASRQVWTVLRLNRTRRCGRSIRRRRKRSSTISPQPFEPARRARRRWRGAWRSRWRSIGRRRVVRPRIGKASPGFASTLPRRSRNGCGPARFRRAPDRKGLPLADLEIEEQLSPPWLDEPDSERGERRAWTEIAISIRNRAAHATYYVRADPAALRYEEGSATLKLLLSPPPLDESLHATFRRPPNFMPVLPGATVVIRETVPVEMKALDFGPDGLRVQVIDISRLQRVEIALDHDTTPFRPLGEEDPLAVRKQLDA